MYIPTIVIICMVCGAMGGTLGYYLTKKNKKEKKALCQIRGMEKNRK